MRTNTSDIQPCAPAQCDRGQFLPYSVGTRTGIATRRAAIVAAVVLVALFGVLSYACAREAPEEEPIAVMQLTGHDVPEAQLGGLTERMRAELFQTGQYVVVERSRVEEILTEQGFQASGCTNTACAVEIGQLIGVRMIVLGSVSHVGKVYSVSLRAVDVADGRIRKVASAHCGECGIGEVLMTTIGEAARGLAGLGSPTHRSTTPRPDTVARSEPPRRAAIRVFTNRNEEIYFDGAYAGTRTITKRVPPGTYKVSLCTPEQLENAKQRLEMARGGMMSAGPVDLVNMAGDVQTSGNSAWRNPSLTLHPLPRQAE